MMTETAFTWVAAPGEELCLDFANTRFWRGQPTPTETLPDLPALLAWCGKSGQVPAALLEAIDRWRETQVEPAIMLFGHALALREAIYRLFHALAEQAPPPPADLAELNAALAEAPARHEIRPAQPGFGWRVEAGALNAATLLTPVLWSAADLLVSRRLPRVRYCANEQCRWLFLDDSKSGNRRWCSMSACGNRAKAHRHYVRSRGGG